MIQKYSFIISLLLIALTFGSNISAQTIGEETIPVSDSKLAIIDLPSGARRIKDKSIPSEIKDTLAKIVASGGDKVRQGDSEVVVWGGNYKKTQGSQIINNLEKTLKNAGWEYEIGEKNSEFILFSLFRAEPQRRALVGFFVPSDEAFIFALTEMIRADASVTTNQTSGTISAQKTNSGGKGTGDLNLLGKWYRGTGSGFIDYTGKTQYKSGESFYFEFFADGTVEYNKETDVLSIMQCRIKGDDKARGKYSVSGNNLTIDLGPMSSVRSNSCNSKENYNKTLDASSVTVNFVVKKMESITRPDNPTILCFNGKEELCYERTTK